MARDHSRPIRPARQEMLRARVVGRACVAPSVVRVTIGGGELDRFAPMGYDQWFRFFFPRDGQTSFRLPGRGDLLGYAQFLATPRSVRPHMRNYSVRELRRTATGTELDIDFVLHDGGVASSWAEEAEEGTEVAVLDEGIGFDASADASWVLLSGDETAIPAIAGICASLPADARGIAFIELPCAQDAQEFGVPDGVEIRWLPRSNDERAGTVALRAVHDAGLPDGTGYAFSVGEAALATGVRRHLVAERGFAKSRVAFCGYWRHPV